MLPPPGRNVTQAGGPEGPVSHRSQRRWPLTALAEGRQAPIWSHAAHEEIAAIKSTTALQKGVFPHHILRHLRSKLTRVVVFWISP